MGGAVQHRAVEAAQPAVHATASRHDGRGGGGSAHPAPSAATRQPEGSGAPTERAAGTVVVVVGSRSGVLAVGGPRRTGQVVHEPALVAGDRRPPRPGGAVARRGEPGPAGRRGALVAYLPAQAAGRHGGASRNAFRREGEDWTACFDGSAPGCPGHPGARPLSPARVRPSRARHNEEDAMVIQHRHQPGSFDPGHCRGCAHEADLLDHYWQVQGEELAFKEAQLWARRAHRHAAWALWASGAGMLLAVIAVVTS